MLEREYKKFNIDVTGNDIDRRWKDYYTDGKWLIGDARIIDTKNFDVVVVAPLLSIGCSGRREDALSLEEVYPSYYSFLHLQNKVVVFVLPGKTLSIQEDRKQLHKFLSFLPKYDILELKDKVTKYVDVYVTN